MKLMNRIIALVVCAFFSSMTFAQSFEKGKMFLDAGIKISVYGVTNNNNNEDDNDGNNVVASYTIPIGFEYALSNKIGAGVEIGICNYFTEEDSVTRAIAKANSFDVLLKGNFHWVRGTRVNLSSGLGIGISAFKYNSNDNFDSKFKSTGTYVRLSLIDFRVYLFGGVGMTACIGIPYMNFNNGRITDSLGSDFSYPLSFAGVDIGTGIIVKF